jgi:hypothetical protein
MRRKCHQELDEGRKGEKVQMAREYAFGNAIKEGKRGAY